MSMLGCGHASDCMHLRPVGTQVLHDAGPPLSTMAWVCVLIAVFIATLQRLLKIWI